MCRVRGRCLRRCRVHDGSGVGSICADNGFVNAADAVTSFGLQLELYMVREEIIQELVDDGVDSTRRTTPSTTTGSFTASRRQLVIAAANNSLLATWRPRKSRGIPGAAACRCGVVPRRPSPRCDGRASACASVLRRGPGRTISSRGCLCELLRGCEVVEKDADAVEKVSEEREDGEDYGVVLLVAEEEEGAGKERVKCDETRTARPALVCQPHHKRLESALRLS